MGNSVMNKLVAILMYRKGEATIWGMVVSLAAMVVKALGYDELGQTVHDVGMMLGTYGLGRKAVVTVAEKVKK